MHVEQQPRPPHPVARALRHHLAVVVLCAVIGGAVGWYYLSVTPTTWTSTASVLVNPSSGNPYASAPSSVRQDEATSLETEAQVARSIEVLAPVATETSLSAAEVEQGLRVVVPPNTQVLQLTFTGSDPEVTRAVTDAVAAAYLANRDRRFDELNDARLDRVADRTLSVVEDLRAATAAAQRGRPGEQAFQRRLADSLSSELVSLRAQRTALENSRSPGGSIISPATEPASSRGLVSLAYPVGGLLAGLVLGLALAVLLERARGRVHSVDDVRRAGLPVLAAVPRPQPWHRTSPSPDQEAETAVRRTRGALLAREPRPDVVAVAPAGTGGPDAGVTEAIAASFARAGHRVVLVQVEQPREVEGVAVHERGLADALLHDRLKPLELLRPSVDPLLSLLPAGNVDEQTRDLLTADRLRPVLRSLVDEGHLVVVEAPGVASPDGDEILAAADLGLVVVTQGRTRSRWLAHAIELTAAVGPELVSLVVSPGTSAHLLRRAAGPVVASTSEADQQEPTDDREPGTSEDGASETTDDRAVSLPATMPGPGVKPSKRNRR